MPVLMQSEPNKALVANFGASSNPNSPWRGLRRAGKKTLGHKIPAVQTGECMLKSALIGAIVTTLFSGIGSALAGPWEDGMVAYNRGDFVPGIRLFPPV